MSFVCTAEVLEETCQVAPEHEPLGRDINSRAWRDYGRKTGDYEGGRIEIGILLHCIKLLLLL